MFTIPDIHTALEPIICWSGAFTDEEIEAIITMGDNLEFQNAKVGSPNTGGDKSDIRKSDIAWINPTTANRWIFVKIAEIVARINNDKFQFDLTDFNDSLQYTTYTTGGFYTWHIDGMAVDTFGPSHRKLGISIMLSDPDTDFTGGEFQIIPGGNPTSVNTTKLKKGDVLAFPSFVPHQVTEVLSGKRKSLVVWIRGPKFK